MQVIKRKMMIFNFYICLKYSNMKKLISISLIILVASVFSFAQDQKKTVSAQFTKAEFLAIQDLKVLLSDINKSTDYSTKLVRNFNLTTTIINPDNTTTKVSESGPGGIFTERQKAIIEKHAKAGVVFTLDNIVVIERGQKGMLDHPGISITIKD